MKPRKFLKDDGDNESKQKINFSYSRGQSGMPLNLPGFQSENKGGADCDLAISMSPIGSKREETISPRKPNFTKPSFKILEYEDHGQDLFEDILQNIEIDKERDNNNPAEDLEISQIKYEERKRVKSIFKIRR